jgi:hypothetical protein
MFAHVLPAQAHFSIYLSVFVLMENDRGFDWFIGLSDSLCELPGPLCGNLSIPGHCRELSGSLCGNFGRSPGLHVS